MSDQYLAEKAHTLEDDPVFKALAEDLGYDATGRPTNNNALDTVGKELARFIEATKRGKTR